MALRRSRVRPPSSPPKDGSTWFGLPAWWGFLAVLGYHPETSITYSWKCRETGFSMEQRIMRIKDCRGQSVAEYAVVLALIVIVVVTVLMGIGQRTRDRLANVNAVNSAFDGGSGAT